MSFFLIDDDFIFRTIAVKQIELFGVTNEILQAENGQDAIQKLTKLDSSTPPEAILLDLNMPIMNGWDFLDVYSSTLNQKFKDVPIWIVTSSINPDDLEKSKSYNCIKGFLNKPLKEEDIQRIKDSAHK